MSEVSPVGFWLNGRFVRYQEVDTVTGNSPFENETLSFIREWILGNQNFHLQTSGSTGKPKLITIHRDQMVASAIATAKALGLKRDDVALLCIDPKYIGGKMMMVRSFVVGMLLIAVEPSANPVEHIRSDQCVNFAAFVPYQIQKIIDSSFSENLNRIEKIIIGGAAIESHTREQLQRFDVKCYATFGMTETISHIALQKVNGPDQQKYFETLPGVTVQTDERGCLTIRAPYLPDTVVTNDMTELVDPTHFRLLGRWDNVINSGGVKIHPEEIEAAIKNILESGGHKTSFVIHSLPDAFLGQKLVLLVEASSNSVETFLTFVGKMREQLHPYQVPKAIATVSALEYTETGKINRLQSAKNIVDVIPIPTSPTWRQR